MRLSKHPTIFVGFAACVLAGGIAIARGDPPPSTPVVISQDYFVVPCSRECQRTEASDVFVGRVASRAAGTPVVEPYFYDARITRTVPATLYNVEVLQVIRGSAAGHVIVHQSGIFDDVPFPTLSDGPPLLEPGEVALFAAVWDGDAGWYDLVGGRLGHY